MKRDRSVFLRLRIAHRLRCFSEEGYVTHTSPLRREGRANSPEDPATGIQITAAAEVMHDLDEAMAGDNERSGHSVHSEPSWLVQPRVQEHPQGVIGVGRRSH